MKQCSTFDSVLGGYVPTIPEPFWIKRWFGRYKPQCVRCNIIFKTRQDWDTHYVLEHLQEDEKI